MPQATLNSILRDISKHVRTLFADRLSSAVLFGSYARGDFDADSDIDVALLVDCSREELRAYQDPLAKLTTDLSLEYGQLVSFICIPYAEYIKWLPALPFYQSIEREGVKLSA